MRKQCWNINVVALTAAAAAVFGSIIFEPYVLCLEANSRIRTTTSRNNNRIRQRHKEDETTTNIEQQRDEDDVHKLRHLRIGGVMEDIQDSDFAFYLGLNDEQSSFSFPPTPRPSRRPTSAPTPQPIANTALPTQAPTQAPTYAPTYAPTPAPTPAPIVVPAITALPSVRPTRSPVPPPTSLPTPTSTVAQTTLTLPTGAPLTGMPTNLPTETPTAMPTNEPTTVEPTASPTDSPTTEEPTAIPTNEPTAEPSSSPPTVEPTASPTDSPTAEPTAIPTDSPTAEPTTAIPTVPPTFEPTTFSPTELPTVTQTTPQTPTPTYYFFLQDYIQDTPRPTPYPTPYPTPPLIAPTIYYPPEDQYRDQHLHDEFDHHHVIFNDNHHGNNDIYQYRTTPLHNDREKQCESIADILCNTDGFHLLCEALRMSGLLEVLDTVGSTSSFTVFAPIDEGFLQLANRLNTRQQLDTDIMLDLLLFHIVKPTEYHHDGGMNSKELICNEWLQMMNDGYSLTHCRGVDKFQVGRGNAVDGVTMDVRHSPIILGDNIQACNGIIHSIDQVMIPA